MIDEIQICEAFDAPPIPEGARLVKNGKYLSVVGADGHPLARCADSRIPYHRYVLFEALGRPSHSPCVHCGYVLPWITSINQAQIRCVNTDHKDGGTTNNSPDNLQPSCGWCNANRSWAEKHPEFWANWRKWLADVEPWSRPNLINIAADFGISVDFTDNGQSTDIQRTLSVNGHTDKRPYSYTAASVRKLVDRQRTTDIGFSERISDRDALVQLLEMFGQSAGVGFSRTELLFFLTDTTERSKSSCLRIIREMRRHGLIVVRQDGSGNYCIPY